MEWIGASYLRQSLHPHLSCAFIFIKLSIRHELIEGRRETLRYYLLLTLMGNQAYLNLQDLPLHIFSGFGLAILLVCYFLLGAGWCSWGFKAKINYLVLDAKLLLINMNYILFFLFLEILKIEKNLTKFFILVNVANW